MTESDIPQLKLSLDYGHAYLVSLALGDLRFHLLRMIIETKEDIDGLTDQLEWCKEDDIQRCIDEIEEGKQAYKDHKYRLKRTKVLRKKVDVYLAKNIKALDDSRTSFPPEKS